MPTGAFLAEACSDRLLLFLSLTQWCCCGRSVAVQKGKERLMVGGLDGRYRIETDAFVGAVQALVVDAESGGGGDAQPGKVVADVGWSRHLRQGRQSGQGGSLQQCVAQRRAVWQGIWGPPGGDFDISGRGVRP